MQQAPVDPWATVPGQPRALAELQAALVAPVHAYLLVGPAGSGKRTAARAFAAALLAEGYDDPAVSDRHVRLAVEEQHPDLHVFERTGPWITADQARSIIVDAARTPVEGTRKVLLLVDFHLVHTAAPMLLKAVEEPSASTIFLILAEHVPPELVPIASRCVRVDFDRLADHVVCETLVAEGVDEERAVEAAAAAGGNLDRARLLATDPRLSVRRSAWRAVPEQLDGTGAVVARLTGELRAHIDDAQAPLDARHATEIAELDAREERYGTRRSGRRELTERHKREVRRLRTDELRFGLATLAARYRDQLSQAYERRVLVEAIDVISDAAEALVRNPNEALLLQALLVQLPPLVP